MTADRCPSCPHPPHAAGECREKVQRIDYIGSYWIGCRCIFTTPASPTQGEQP